MKSSVRFMPAKMNKMNFKMVRVIGSGKYSVIYEVICTRGKYKNRKFALKRYFLSEHNAICRALHERKILTSLGLGNSKNPFITSLFFATGGWKTPSCICTLGSEYNLNDLVISVGLFSEEDARFYLAEIMCGLEYIHKKNIVHRDIKLKNILLSQTGHAIITDFDLAHNLLGGGVLRSVIFAGTLDYMAPEIANSVVVTKKADIWSLGALVAHLISPKFRKNTGDLNEKLHQARLGAYEIPNAASLSVELIELINACLEYDYAARPEVEDLKSFAFFNSIDWSKVAACQLEPPFKINQLAYSHIDGFAVDPFDENVLMTAFQPNKPILEYKSGASHTSKLQSVPKNMENLKKYGYTDVKIQRLFQNFDFVSSLYKRTSDVED
ncbi:hypothetical protein ACTXT7_016609 [Hymenolepis weldensis]